MSRRWDKWVAHLIIRAGLLSVLERVEARRENVLRILVYHRVGSPETETGRLDQGLLNASPEMFAQQMRFLSDHYRLVSLDELLSSLASHRPLPPRSVMVTFDDGYRDFLDSAWPVLQRLQVPTILFVATGYLAEGGRLFWWDQLHQAFSQTEHEELRIPPLGTWSLRSAEQRLRAAAEVKRCIREMNHYQAMSLVEDILEILDVSPITDGAMLTWQDVRRLSADGLVVGAHTRSHPILSRVSPEEARREIVNSHQDLVRELGQTWPVFAYPGGSQDTLRPQLISTLREEGFQVAMTMIQGHNAVGRTSPFRLRRLGMASHLSMAEFRLVLTGIYDIYASLLRFRATTR